MYRSDVKPCFKCNKWKPLSDFYKHKQMKDGYLNKCKICASNDIIEYRKNNDSVREYDKWRYYNDPNKKASIIEHTQNWINRNPEARKAHSILNNAVRTGKITKEPCKICGDTYRIHGHHDNYSEPLKVKWFCAKHHQRYHHKV